MNHEVLDQQVRERTREKMSLASTIVGYLDEVRAAAEVLEIPVSNSKAVTSEARLEVELDHAPDLRVGWTPYQGWYYRTDQDDVYYRVGSETDAASLMPEASAVAGWLQLLSTGNRDGHADAPEELDPEDQALVERLVTFGGGADPHSPD
ncbi:DUF6292 family protein [Saccharopolyspora gloriosae]|uniref:DUF6292 family protein n=1 Tax=Saccharopolyspora gloriosae TaxID=455344 RepID=UPI001FB772D9|nr:DUF6292 family protein [Saccharopolyspora gloriosae]